MNSAALVWALWVFAGGPVNSGGLQSPAPVAYFADEAECQRVANTVVTSTKSVDGKPYYFIDSYRVRCVQGRYLR